MWWCGLALILGGLIGAIGTLIRPVSELTSSTLDPIWTPLNVAYTASNLLLAFGMVGIYLRQAEAVAGWLGMLILLITFADATMSSGQTVIAAYAFPYIALQPDAPELISGIISPGGPLAAMVPYMQVLYTLDWGWVALGLLVARAGVLAPASGWLLLVSSLITMLLPLPNNVMWLSMIAQVAFALSFAWIGFQLLGLPSAWRRPAQT
jgi:hypothetical protein